VKVVVPGFIKIEIEIGEWDGLSIPVLPIPKYFKTRRKQNIVTLSNYFSVSENLALY
jgi:hypothetical protein